MSCVIADINTEGANQKIAVLGVLEYFLQIPLSLIPHDLAWYI
jgi:hypothetical protein